MTDKYQQTAEEIAKLVESKQAAYGDSFGKAGKVMGILYPEGVPAEKLDDALTVVRVLDKLFRIATSVNAFGEDPWKDILGYSLLSVVRRKGQQPTETVTFESADSVAKFSRCNHYSSFPNPPGHRCGLIQGHFGKHEAYSNDFISDGFIIWEAK